MRDIPYYNDYISPAILEHLKSSSRPLQGIEHLVEIGTGGGLENRESLTFLCQLYEDVKAELNIVLNQRLIDRRFIDQQTRAAFDFNQLLKRDILSADYKTILGFEDSKGRIVMGPKNKEFFCKKGYGSPIAPLPDFLKGHHVTLFGPPDDTKLSINAMNAYHRKLKSEPKVIEKLLNTFQSSPKWGADDEDSKTPLRRDLVSAGVNLTECFEGSIRLQDEKNGKLYELEKDHLALPIKRFPGLALPSFFFLYRNNPIPLHLYDFALHLFKNWQNPNALVFYVPKLENEEEARYIKIMIEKAENLIKKMHPEYSVGSIRLMIVLENPRAVFRVNEIMDELYPYFAGASLGWHDYLASTARVFKEDGNYRIPVKADPNIVIKYIKASHHLLAEVVGSRGGIKVGGMYGILPVTTDLSSPSFQITIKGYIKDVITQMKRDLSGFWVAHPDFVRIGMALVEGWNQYSKGDKANLETLIMELIHQPKDQQDLLNFISGPDISGLDLTDPRYERSLLVADIKESNFIANNHPDEIRYNVFQSLQYLTDWLSGNGCVALPAQISEIPVRVMDDLATAERSRWEVWHEIYHKRFDLFDFLKIAHEEMHFIRKDLSNDKKIVQVKWDQRTEKWYPVAMNLMIRLMTDKKPLEFATELLLPFTLDSVRESLDPWKSIQSIDPEKFSMDQTIERFNYYFSMCGSLAFATSMAKNISIDFDAAQKCIMRFNKVDILEAAGFHGNIGESQKTLDHMAAREQSLVLKEEQTVINHLIINGKKYLDKFGMKFLISAKDKSGPEILKILNERISNSLEIEIENAKKELWSITFNRMTDIPFNSLLETLSSLLSKHNITGAMISISTAQDKIQTIPLGESTKGIKPVTRETWFEMASLSKTVASCFAMEYFAKHKISLSTSVNSLLEKTTSTFRLTGSWSDEVTISHLMSHSALNMHYVNGVPANQEMPAIRNFLDGNTQFQYPPISVIHKPGTTFQYSGGGFLVLEHLIESLENQSITHLTQKFLDELGMSDFSFEQKTLPKKDYATGYLDNGEQVVANRKMFPSFAAGAMGTTESMTKFLHHLTKAYHCLEGSAGISHSTARNMLYGTDKGCIQFMGAKMGLGIFIAEAGANKLALHQGANDGFRSLYIHCYEGPNTGLGMTLFCNANLPGVFFNAEAAQAIFSELKMEGVDLSKFATNFDMKNIPQEELVNIGYKNCIFGAFEASLPEKIINQGPIDPMAKFNLAVGAKILSVSNQKFARAENLLSDHLPTFDPDLFGAQGKIMDSWETVRHNQMECDTLVFELKKESPIKYISVSTKFHLGNQAQFIRLEAEDSNSQQWIEILPKTKLEGHALKKMLAVNSQKAFSKIKVSLFPDGGLTRLGLYSENLPEDEKKQFLPSDIAPSILFKNEIAKTHKPLAAPYAPSEMEIKKNLESLKSLKSGEEYDVANLAFGGKLIFASNEHYGPAIQTISPYGPMHMFDGFESARSRVSGHHEEVIIQLSKSSIIHRLLLDFSFFVNNNPFKVSVYGLSGNDWKLIVEKTNVKSFAGNVCELKISSKDFFQQIKVIAHPDGGINRIRVMTRA